MSKGPTNASLYLGRKISDFGIEARGQEHPFAPLKYEGAEGRQRGWEWETQGRCERLGSKT